MVLQCDEEPVDMPPEELRHLIFQSIKNKRDEVFLLKDLVGSDGIRDEDVIHTMRDPDIDKVDGLTGQETTYRELHDKATSIAMFLNKIDVEQGVVVGILSDVMIEANYFLTGVWLSGGILCTMNPNLKKDGGSGNDDRITDTGVEDDDQQLVDFFKFLEILIDLFH